MTDTNTLAPTDAEIIALADETRTGEPGRDGYILPISFARAVLAKFGAPATAASEALITIESSLRFRLACAKDDVEQLEFENRKLRECVAGLKAAPASQPVAVPAGMEPVAWRLHPFDYGIGSEGVYALTQTEHLRGTWIKKGWAPEPLYTAAQVLAMLDAAPRNAPLYDPDDVAFSAWCCAMDDGITAAQKGGQHAER